jgi:hypothetical protein
LQFSFIGWVAIMKKTLTKNKIGQNGAEVMLYLLSKERILRLGKVINFKIFPRLNEWIQIHIKDKWSDLSYQVVQITHREKGIPEIWLKASSSEGNNQGVSYFEDKDMNNYAKAYLKSGWRKLSEKKNTTYRKNGLPIWFKNKT